MPVLFCSLYAAGVFFHRADPKTNLPLKIKFQAMESAIHFNKSFTNLVYLEKISRGREFEQCTFVGCDFSGGGFSNCKFVDCAFTACNLSNAGLINCQIKNVTFKDCKLMGINFSECADFMFTVSFEGCLLDYASFVRKKMPKTLFSRTSLRSVDFTECDLTKSQFIMADLTDAVFQKSILKEANLVSATNFFIDPELNNIRKAKFSIYGLPGLLARYGIIVE